MRPRFILSRLLKGLLVLSLLNAQLSVAALPPSLELSLPEEAGCLWGVRFVPKGDSVTGDPVPGEPATSGPVASGFVTIVADVCTPATIPFPDPQPLTWRPASAYTTGPLGLGSTLDMGSTPTHLTLRHPQFEVVLSYPQGQPWEMAASLLPPAGGRHLPGRPTRVGPPPRQGSTFSFPLTPRMGEKASSMCGCGWTAPSPFMPFMAPPAV